MTHHPSSSLREEARALAGQGMSLADRPASTFYTRPARSGGSDGEPGTPSDDAESAKMESGCTRNPGRAPEGVNHSLKSSQAVTHSHSVSPNPSRDGTDRALLNSSPEAGTYSNHELGTGEAQAAPFSLACLNLPDTPTLAGADTSVADLPASFLFDPVFLAAWRESQGQPVDAVPRPVLTAQLSMGIGA